MDSLKHVLWIGGPSGSGKTTVGRRIARRHGLRWYNSDAHTWSHRDRALSQGHPGAELFERLSPAERAAAGPADMLAMSLHVERGQMTVDDLRALPATPLILAEGTQITPEIVGPDGCAIWLTLSAEQQRERLDRRHGAEGAPPSYLAFRKIIEAEIGDDPRVLDVDDLTMDETIAAVEGIFAERIAAGPSATTPAERREILRYANQIIVDQHLAWLRRWWTTGDPATMVRTFDCECGQPSCGARIDLALADYPAEPLLAPGHQLST